MERFSGIPPRLVSITSIDDAFLFKLYFFKYVDGKIKWTSIISKEINIGNRVGSNTEYVIALLPLGGYVKMAGMIDESMDTKLEHKSDEFQSKNLLEKIWVLSAEC